MTSIVGLDLGTNSIGWSLIRNNNGKYQIVGMGSRIIPMDQASLSEFERGNTKSQTAERTNFRSIRRLRERSLLRRERLFRVLNVLEFLPKHLVGEMDFDKHPGQYLDQQESKIAYRKNTETGKYEFVFQESFNEMLADFAIAQPELVSDGRKVTHDWTIYYLRKKALSHKISREELAWILLHFNQKRGYYQLRGEEEEELLDKQEEFYSLKVIEIQNTGDRRGKDTWYDIVLENGWHYRRTFSVAPDWLGREKDFIVTTFFNKDGSPKVDEKGNVRRSFRAPAPDDWSLVKKKTERDIANSQKTIGCYIYDTLLQRPYQKIRGKLVRTIERKYYKEELISILKKQLEFHPDLSDNDIYRCCIDELYPYNNAHRENIGNRGFVYLFVDDIIFYQRPLKSKKNLIADCPYESRNKQDAEGNPVVKPLKCIARSNPLFQEFRLWQFLGNLRIYEREREVDGKLHTDVDVTSSFYSSEEARVELFDWLNNRKEIDQKSFFKYPAFGLKKGEIQYRWNYVEDKTYPCNETRAAILKSLSAIPGTDKTDVLDQDMEMSLWHLLYSVEDKKEFEKALRTFAGKHHFREDDFVQAFSKFRPFEKQYGAYSEKAIKKLLPLMREGKYWKPELIDGATLKRIEMLLSGEVDDAISSRVREKTAHLSTLDLFKRLHVSLACYIVYNRYAESTDTGKWNSPEELEYYLNNVFKQHSLRNPVVEQVVTETLRIVRDIWKKWGTIDEIHIELGREMKATSDQRRRMSEQASQNENTNQRIRYLLMELKESGGADSVRPYSPSQQEILKIYEEGVLCAANEVPDDIYKISRQAQPSRNELVRYLLWMEQKYCSPYTGEVIPLSKLFTPAYEIEHIIPQSRYFDDSISNKVICESEVNKDKGNLLGYEYIKKKRGTLIELSYGKPPAKLFTEDEYLHYVKHHYATNRSKMKKLLLDDIPDIFIARQLNDSRYMSRYLQFLLSKVVRTANDDMESVSKNVISGNGSVTNRLKQDWGLNDVWNTLVTPRFERMNQLTKSSAFGEWENKSGKRIFQTQVPLEYRAGFNKKRIDHRHHAMDALVIACMTRSHINYLNNQSANSETQRYDLRYGLCEKRKQDGAGNYSWLFKKPWDTFTQDALAALQFTVVSFKKNLRVINKTVNYYQHWEEGHDGKPKKIFIKQTKGDNWAIRKPMHKDTVSGLVSLERRKTVRLSASLDDWENITDRRLRSKIRELIIVYKYDKTKLLAYFKGMENKFNNRDISSVEIRYFDINTASRVPLDATFTAKKIEQITDSGIRQILFRHLENNAGDASLAFSEDGIEEMNGTLIKLNNGTLHAPIRKVRTCESLGNKFAVGYTGSKNTKYVEAAKGTNLFFAIYQNEKGERSYETVPLNIVIERQKQGLPSVPEHNSAGDTLLMYLSPNDLVYVPTEEDLAGEKVYMMDKGRIYKMVSSTGKQCFFIPAYVASPILQTIELGANNKAEKSWDGLMIKQVCKKINVDRLGEM